jgi:prepilin-type N-terminal cleavage/methylation domain-containing protein
VGSLWRRHGGFTLIEVLVATFVLGILLTAIIGLSSGYLGFSRRVSTINERLADLNDALGYVASNARSAMNVIGADGTSVDVTAGGTTFTCETIAADPCLAFVVPVVDRTTTASDITGFDLLAYRIAPLSAWADDPGLAPGWNGTGTPTMLEYRVSLCTGCTTPPAVPAAVTAARTSLVTSDLTLDTGAGTFVPFEVTETGTVVTLRVRSRGAGLEANTFVPGQGPLEVTVARRP